MPVRGITVLCHFHKNDLMSLISCLTSLTFWSLFHVIAITFCPKTCLGHMMLKIQLCFIVFTQIGFLIHFISAAHCCPPVLIEDITQIWQDACHIWKYDSINCYKMLVIFTYNDRHYVIFMINFILWSDEISVLVLIASSNFGNTLTNSYVMLPSFAFAYFYLLTRVWLWFLDHAHFSHSA